MGEKEKKGKGGRGHLLRDRAGGAEDLVADGNDPRRFIVIVHQRARASATLQAFRPMTVSWV